MKSGYGRHDNDRYHHETLYYHFSDILCYDMHMKVCKSIFCINVHTVKFDSDFT